MAEGSPKTGPRELGLRAQLIRGGMAGMALRAGSILAGLAAAVTLARLLGPETYGIYAFVFSVIAMLGLPVKVGLPTLILRETARADQAADGALMTGIWRWSTRTMLILSACVIAATLAYLWVFADADRSPRMVALVWALPLIPLIGFAEAKSAAIRGLRRVFLGGFTGKILRPLLLSVSVIGLAFFAPGLLSAANVFVVHSVVAAVTLGLALMILYKVQPRHAGSDNPTVNSRGWIAAILPLAAIAGLQMISHNTDILMLGIMTTDTDVGLYRVALSGANIALFGLTTANLVLQPHFARAWQANDNRRLHKLATAGARISTAASLPVLAIFWFGGTSLLTFVFGDAYASAFWALILLCLGQSVSALFGSVGNLLIMSGREKIALGGMVISTVSNITLNWVLIPRYGIEGAAIATGLSIVIWNLCLWGAARVLMGIDTSFVGLKPRAMSAAVVVP